MFLSIFSPFSRFFHFTFVATSSEITSVYSIKQSVDHSFRSVYTLDPSSGPAYPNCTSWGTSPEYTTRAVQSKPLTPPCSNCATTIDSSIDPHTLSI